MLADHHSRRKPYPYPPTQDELNNRSPSKAKAITRRCISDKPGTLNFYAPVVREALHAVKDKVKIRMCLKDPMLKEAAALATSKDFLIEERALRKLAGKFLSVLSSLLAHAHLFSVMLIDNDMIQMVSTRHLCCLGIKLTCLFQDQP